MNRLLSSLRAPMAGVALHVAARPFGLRVAGLHTLSAAVPKPSLLKPIAVAARPRLPVGKPMTVRHAQFPRAVAEAPARGHLRQLTVWSGAGWELESTLWEEAGYVFFNRQPIRGKFGDLADPVKVPINFRDHRYVACVGGRAATADKPGVPVHQPWWFRMEDSTIVACPECEQVFKGVQPRPVKWTEYYDGEEWNDEF